MCQIPKNFITSDMVYHLRCDAPKQEPRVLDKYWLRPRFMFVFENGDLNLAAHCLAESMHEPFQPFTIASVAVQSSVRDEFVERLRSRFHQVKPHVAMHPNFQRSLQELKLGNIKHEVADIANAPPFASPILVTDNVTHLRFSNRPSGVVTLKTFDTIREAAESFSEERPPFDVINVFDESVASVYTLAAHMNAIQFYVNCIDVCLLPILSFYDMRQPRALIHDGYHFESLQVNSNWRIIVFPYRTSFLAGESSCLSTDQKGCE